MTYSIMKVFANEPHKIQVVILIFNFNHYDFGLLSFDQTLSLFGEFVNPDLRRSNNCNYFS